MHSVNRQPGGCSIYRHLYSLLIDNRDGTFTVICMQVNARIRLRLTEFEVRVGSKFNFKEYFVCIFVQARESLPD